ncbi:hypothetical protein [Streptomyces similanensis]|uniref:Integrase n=1 Tax=Streptomyces similanensis TaxID=1274988 RepID=A0ABP9L9A1_9ACTN
MLKRFAAGQRDAVPVDVGPPRSEALDGLGWIRRVFDRSSFNVAGMPAMSVPATADTGTEFPLGGAVMTVEPVTELGSGGALRLSRARVAPMAALPRRTPRRSSAYLTGAGIAKFSACVYRISLTTWGWMLAGEPAPTGPARRGAKPPVFHVTAIDDPALPEVLAELAAARADEMDADTVNRELSIARRAIGWWQRQRWIEGDTAIGIERRSASAAGPNQGSRREPDRRPVVPRRRAAGEEGVEDALRVRRASR